MRQIRQIPTRLFKPVQLTLSAILTVPAFLAITGAARAGGYRVFGPVSEFFGPAREPDAAAPLVKTGARENIFLAASGGFSPFTLAAPTYSTVGAAITENFNGMGSSGTAALPADWRFGSTIGLFRGRHGCAAGRRDQRRRYPERDFGWGILQFRQRGNRHGP